MKTKKKILFVITRSHWGGAQRYLYDIATHLPKDEYDVKVVTGGEGALAGKLTEKNIPVFLLDTTRNIRIREEIKTFFALLRILRDERPDIVHLNSSKIGGIGALAAWLMGVPKIIFTAHGWAFREDRPFLARAAIFLFSWISALFHDHIICVSDRDSRSAEALPLVHKKCVTIKNAILAPQFLEKSEAQSYFKKEKNVFPAPTSLWIGTISELTKNKGVIHAIRGLSRIKDLPWIFVVVGEGEERPRLEKEIERLDLKERVFLTGHISDASRFLKAFDIFFLTSEKEGFPYALLEAAHAGLPILASETGGIPEIIHGGKTGLLAPPKNEARIAMYAKELIENKKLRDYLAKNAAAHAAKEYAFSVMLERTTEIYKKLKK